MQYQNSRTNSEHKIYDHLVIFTQKPNNSQTAILNFPAFSRNCHKQSHLQ